MSNVMNKLKGILDMPLNKFFEVPIPTLNCHVCELPEQIYYWFRGENGCKVGACEDCYHELPICANCDSRSIYVGEHGICHQCVHDSARVRSYGHKPMAVFHRINNNRISNPPLMTDRSYSRDEDGHSFENIHLGVENEFDRKRNSNGNIQYHGNKIASLINLISRGTTGKEQLLYTKRDGSLSDEGIEVVSHPFTWNYWLLYGQSIYRTLFQKLTENNMYSYDTHDCGMHVHVSRRALSTNVIVKLVQFISNPSNFDFILDISQRTEDKLRYWSNPAELEGYSRNELYELCNDCHYAEGEIDRLLAINLHNSHTIEFRIFRGTINFLSFCKNLEFVRSLILWVQSEGIDSDVVTMKDSYQDYIQWLNMEENTNEYSSLCFFLSKRGYGEFQIAQDNIEKGYGDLDLLTFDDDYKRIVD